MSDNRIVLPRDVLLRAAVDFCRRACLEHVHDDHCLIPVVIGLDAQRDETYRITSVSGDCLDPVKHRTCSGCACVCHLKTSNKKPTSDRTSA